MEINYKYCTYSVLEGLVRRKTGQSARDKNIDFCVGCPVLPEWVDRQTDIPFAFLAGHQWTGSLRPNEPVLYYKHNINYFIPNWHSRSQQRDVVYYKCIFTCLLVHPDRANVDSYVAIWWF